MIGLSICICMSSIFTCLLSRCCPSVPVAHLSLRVYCLSVLMFCPSLLACHPSVLVWRPSLSVCSLSVLVDGASIMELTFLIIFTRRLQLFCWVRNISGTGMSTIFFLSSLFNKLLNLTMQNILFPSYTMLISLTHTHTKVNHCPYNFLNILINE